MAPEKIDLDRNKEEHISGDTAILLAHLRSYKTGTKQTILLSRVILQWEL